MAAADVTVTQDGGQSNVRLHPYLLALIRWCVSSVWSAGAVVLHRLMVTPLPSIAGTPRTQYKPRPAGRDHLHPEPLVECVVLHEPSNVDMDVIFVHGLYGSLSNTWRQGEWRSKYKSGPVKVPLRRSEFLSKESSNQKNTVKEVNGKICDVNIENRLNYQETQVFLEGKENICLDIHKSNYTNSDHTNININKENKSNYEKSKVSLEEKQSIFTDKPKDEISDIYNSLRKNNENDENSRKYKEMKTVLADEGIYVDKDFYERALKDQVDIIDNYETPAEFVRNLYDYETNKYCDNPNIKCDNQFNYKDEKYELRECECKVIDNKSCIGCGCICDECYSPCWPRDWIRADYPNARVISINYTSDPHLWRPLWIKGSKRLRLHERAEQMMDQLLSLGVGQRPTIWVGHSKGGLFIKHIYCEAYEAHLALNESEKDNLNNFTEINLENYDTFREKNNKNGASEKHTNFTEEKCDIELNKNKKIDFKVRNNIKYNNSFKIENNVETDKTEASIRNGDIGNSTMIVDVENELRRRSTLWSNSAGFMFYSVPHRGSPLADFKTPITARSIELMEICKDCSLVLSLQERWLAATRLRPSAPVRSLVETCRTLMSVLWLRIVSVDSADAGIGTLHGVSLDHREICKPSSRQCMLYTELMELIRTALDRREKIEKIDANSVVL